MNTSSIGATGGLQSTIGMQDFMKVLMAQLTYQDPLKPIDNNQFMAQIAQFTALEQAQQMNTKLHGLLNNSGIQQSVGLLGRTVSITTPDGPFTGQVTSIDLSGPAPTFTLQVIGSKTIPNVSLGQITKIDITPNHEKPPAKSLALF